MAKSKARSPKVRRKTTARIKDLAPKPASTRMVSGGRKRSKGIVYTDT
jgi:hypothetical protein